ncbi:MAG TPA: MFS transporter, partial [Microlunatus sp.]|nr:MFS transporter [Microlunatus sp.]
GLIALLRPAVPLIVIAAVLLLSGVFRSIGFSAYNTLQFADLDPSMVADANTLSSTLQQVATALGVAVGALVLRLAGEIPSLAGSPVAPYSLTFAVLGLLMLQPLVEVLRLHRTAGEEATRR